MGKHELERPRYKMHAGEKEALKQVLYERANGICEHPQGCNETDINKLTIDHFTPQSIARIWGWAPEEVNDPLNLLLLCRVHHDEKDALTPSIKALNLIEYKSIKPFAVAIRRTFEQRRIETLEQELLIA